MRLFVLFSVVALALSASPAWCNAGGARFVQDRFAIGFWVDPPANQITDARYKEIADANFTFVLGAFGPKTVKDIKKQLALCEKYDLKAIVKSDLTKPEDLPDSPACWGYHLVDEPNTNAFADLRTRVDTIRKVRPGKLSYINLLPDYASPGQLGAKNYDEYVARFCKDTWCDVLCMDYYPMMTPTADGRKGYCGNLAALRKYSLKYNIPFWNFFNCMPFGPHYDPTEAQLRWQVYTSLAYGAKGVLYFCYWTPRGGEFPKGGAILTPDGKRTRHYDQAKRINAMLKNLGPTLMKLTSVDVIRIKPTDDPTKMPEKCPIKSITPGDYLVGVFKHADGRRAVLLNNYDHSYTSWPTVEFDVPNDQVKEIDPANGKEKPVLDDSPDMQGLQLSLDAGEGRLFLLP